MPRIYRLGKYNSSLEEISLIIGDGLCSNIYVIGKEEVTMIDTGVGNSSNPIFPQLKDLGIHPESIKQVILTHEHHDHAMGVYLILEKAVPKIYVHEKATKYFAPNFGDFIYKLNDGAIIDTSIGHFKVYWTPGHTRGSICLYNSKKKILVSGDTVFPDGYYGRYNGEGGSFDTIVESLRKLTKLDCEVMLPGHGSPVFQDANSHIGLSYSQATRPW
jgi:glyoxylase-like metal-dependent hydrolase (beta-lactamase superfamily II)